MCVCVVIMFQYKYLHKIMSVAVYVGDCFLNVQTWLPTLYMYLARGQYAQTPRLYPVLLKEPWVNLFVARA